MVIGLILGGLLGYFGTKYGYEATKATYDRKSIDSILDGMFSQYRMEDALTDELLLMAYSFNDAEPRLYSKYNAKKNPNTYNITLAQAAEASSAAPIYFDPKEILNGWGENEVLIDGGVIANNPTLYAYILATEFN